MLDYSLLKITRFYQRIKLGVISQITASLKHLHDEVAFYFNRVKRSIVMITLIKAVFVATLLVVASCTQARNPLMGTWRMIETRNGFGAAMTDSVFRTWEFKGDGTFSGLLHTPRGTRLYNAGDFMLVDDTTMVTIHHDRDNRRIPVAHYFNFNIQRDTMHFYGHVIQRHPETKSLQWFQIDEKWVKGTVMPELNK